MSAARVELYRRVDGRWAWRAVADNGQVVATDGGQGYEHRTDAADQAFEVTGLVPVEVDGDDAA